MLTDTQILARREGIGGSDIPVLLGYYASFGKTPFTLWESKMGLSEPQEENENIRRGNEREPVIRLATEVLLGESILEHPATIYHSVPHALCHVDGFIGYAPSGVLEIKRPASYTKLKEAWLVQLQWNMLVADCTWGRIAWEYDAKDGGTVLQISPVIQRDDELCKGLIELTRRFWRCVERKEWDESWNQQS